MKLSNFIGHTDIGEDHELGQYPLVHFEKKEFTNVSILIEKLYFKAAFIEFCVLPEKNLQRRCGKISGEKPPAKNLHCKWKQTF